MPRVLRWCVWGVNERRGTVWHVDNLTARPEEVPTDFVIRINQMVDGGRDSKHLDYHDRYIYLSRQEVWVPSDIHNLGARRAAGVEIRAVLNGIYTYDELFLAALHEADADERFPNALGPTSFSREELHRLRRVQDLTRAEIRAERALEDAETAPTREG